MAASLATGVARFVRVVTGSARRRELNAAEEGDRLRSEYRRLFFLCDEQINGRWGPRTCCRRVVHRGQHVAFEYNCRRVAAVWPREKR